MVIRRAAASGRCSPARCWRVFRLCPARATDAVRSPRSPRRLGVPLKGSASSALSSAARAAAEAAENRTRLAAARGSDSSAERASGATQAHPPGSSLSTLTIHGRIGRLRRACRSSWPAERPGDRAALRRVRGVGRQARLPLGSACTRRRIRRARPTAERRRASVHGTARDRLRPPADGCSRRLRGHLDPVGRPRRASSRRGSRLPHAPRQTDLAPMAVRLHTDNALAAPKIARELALAQPHAHVARVNSNWALELPSAAQAHQPTIVLDVPGPASMAEAGDLVPRVELLFIAVKRARRPASERSTPNAEPCAHAGDCQDRGRPAGEDCRCTPARWAAAAARRARRAGMQSHENRNSRALACAAAGCVVRTRLNAAARVRLMRPPSATRRRSAVLRQQPRAVQLLDDASFRRGWRPLADAAAACASTSAARAWRRRAAGEHSPAGETSRRATRVDQLPIDAKWAPGERRLAASAHRREDAHRGVAHEIAARARAARRATPLAGVEPLAPSISASRFTAAIGAAPRRLGDAFGGSCTLTSSDAARFPRRSSPPRPIAAHESPRARARRLRRAPRCSAPARRDAFTASASDASPPTPPSAWRGAWARPIASRAAEPSSPARTARRPSAGAARARTARRRAARARSRSTAASCARPSATCGGALVRGEMGEQPAERALEPGGTRQYVDDAHRRASWSTPSLRGRAADAPDCTGGHGARRPPRCFVDAAPFGRGAGDAAARARARASLVCSQTTARGCARRATHGH